jgi:hypothetical protein
MPDEFTQAYIECALWSSTDDNDKAFGAGDGPNEREDMSHGLTWEDLDDATLAQCVEDCRAFQDDNRGYLERAGDASQNGHDFWLTRNGHGAGFWDRGYDVDVDDHLTQAAHAFGEVYLYLHENKVYS